MNGATFKTHKAFQKSALKSVFAKLSQSSIQFSHSEGKHLMAIVSDIGKVIFIIPTRYNNDSVYGTVTLRLGKMSLDVSIISDTGSLHSTFGIL